MSKAKERGDPLIVADGAGIAPGQSEYLRCSATADEPAGGQFSIDHWQSAERDAEPVDCR